MNAKLYLVLTFGLFAKVKSEFKPTWESLDNRTLPEWYDQAKIGIFLHWGVYSVPSVSSEWFWSQWQGGDKEALELIGQNYPPKWTYQDFAREFTAEFYNPSEWADIFVKAGAKYVVLTSKHHEGYALWPSKYSYSWNANDVGPHRDLLGDLATAVKLKGLRFGVYHSLLEWYHPLYEEDKANSWNTSTFVDTKVIPEMKELVNNYNPDILWSDGNWEASDIYWKSTEFLSWLYNESPVKDVVVSNDRWGSNTQCVHGDIFTCQDRYNPGVLQTHKWENAMTVDKFSWGYRRNAKYAEILTIEEIISTLAQTVSCGGNILINVGPTKEGTIIPIFQERLLQLGTWLNINGEGIYKTTPWIIQQDDMTSSVWYTAKDPVVYAIVLEWPKPNNRLNLRIASYLFQNQDTKVTLLGNSDQPLSWTTADDLVVIDFPDRAIVTSDWAWVVKITPA